MNALARILVPVDFSPCARAALDQAARLAERFDSAIHVLHVWQPPQLLAPEMLIVPRGEGLLIEFAHTGDGLEMERYLALLERRSIRARGRLESGEPVATILRMAREEEFDLIVMGTHGRTGLAHFLFGGVAERVVRRASCPVLTVRRADGPFVDPVAEASP